MNNRRVVGRQKQSTALAGKSFNSTHNVAAVLNASNDRLDGEGCCDGLERSHEEVSGWIIGIDQTGDASDVRRDLLKRRIAELNNRRHGAR